MFNLIINNNFILVTVRRGKKYLNRSATMTKPQLGQSFNVGQKDQRHEIEHLRNDVKQHTRTSFPSIPGWNSMMWIGWEGR